MAVETCWFDPATGTVRECGSHGEDVRDNPDAFGIPAETLADMYEAFGNGSRGDPGLTAEADEEWERLAIGRGWVRLGAYFDTRRGLDVGYVSARDVPSAWSAVRLMASQGKLARSVSVSIQDCDMGGVERLDLSGRKLASFLRMRPCPAHRDAPPAPGVGFGPG